jgi:hypothetical protein
MGRTFRMHRSVEECIQDFNGKTRRVRTTKMA